jgi:hypothetical protein
MGLIRGSLGCLRRLTALIALVAIAGAAWLYRDRLALFVDDLRGRATGVAIEPSEALALRAEARFDSLSGGELTRAALSQVEVQSLVQYRYAQLLPAFVASPRVELAADRLRLRLRIPTDRLPRVGGLTEILTLLPDTTDVAITGQLLPMDGQRIALAIDAVEAARIPIPRRLVPAVLERLGRSDEPGLPADAIAVPLPRGVHGAYVRGDSLVLLARTGDNGSR